MGKRTSVYLTGADQARLEASGLSLPEVIRKGLDAAETLGLEEPWVTPEGDCWLYFPQFRQWHGWHPGEDGLWVRTIEEFRRSYPDAPKVDEVRAVLQGGPAHGRVISVRPGDDHICVAITPVPLPEPPEPAPTLHYRLAASDAETLTYAYDETL